MSHNPELPTGPSPKSPGAEPLSHGSPFNSGSNLIKRRGVLAAGLALSSGGWWLSGCAAADNGLAGDASPADVLTYLYSGNERFTQGKPLEINRDIPRVRQVAKEQKPFAAFLGCADSRVPIEIVFDQGFGDLFVFGTLATSPPVKTSVALSSERLSWGPRFFTYWGIPTAEPLPQRLKQMTYLDKSAGCSSTFVRRPRNPKGILPQPLKSTCAIKRSLSQSLRR